MLHEMIHTYECLLQKENHALDVEKKLYVEFGLLIKNIDSIINAEDDIFKGYSNLFMLKSLSLDFIRELKFGVHLFCRWDF